MRAPNPQQGAAPAQHQVQRLPARLALCYRRHWQRPMELIADQTQRRVDRGRVLSQPRGPL
jgi:hypothetical protein